MAAHGGEQPLAPGASDVDAIDPSNLTYADVSHLLPADDSGYRITADDCRFLDISPREIADWDARTAPLGLTPDQFAEFKATLSDALRLDGIDPEQVDVRLQGSSANFFSGAHKELPTAEQITDPEALRRYREWRGDAPTHPLRRPFDSMYKLGLDPEPSDYDVQISSDAIVARADEARQRSQTDGPLFHPKYGFVDKYLVGDACPNLIEWAKQQSQALGRSVVPAVFSGTGPPDNSGTGRVSAHFRDSDWMIELKGSR